MRGEHLVDWAMMALLSDSQLGSDLLSRSRSPANSYRGRSCQIFVWGNGWVGLLSQYVNSTKLWFTCENTKKLLRRFSQTTAQCSITYVYRHSPYCLCNRQKRVFVYFQIRDSALSFFPGLDLAPISTVKNLVAFFYEGSCELTRIYTQSFLCKELLRVKHEARTPQVHRRVSPLHWFDRVSLRARSVVWVWFVKCSSRHNECKLILCYSLNSESTFPQKVPGLDIGKFLLIRVWFKIIRDGFIVSDRRPVFCAAVCVRVTSAITSGIIYVSNVFRPSVFNLVSYPFAKSGSVFLAHAVKLCSLVF